MQIDQGALAVIAVFAAGVCVNAGAVLQVLRNHEKRISTNEGRCEDCGRTVIQLKTLAKAEGANI